MKDGDNSFDLEKEQGREAFQTLFTDELINIEDYVQHLTNTITDFRTFYAPNKKYDFIYVSLPHPHKNHFKLLNACSILSKKGIVMSIALTIPEHRRDILERVNEINKNNVVTHITLRITLT